MDRPNILLITTDQQRFDTIAALGNGTIDTPHLNWLHDEGISFTRCYADSPVCMPSRATIMSGLPGFQTGYTANCSDIPPMASHPTLPGLLSDAGYQTRAQGKMHFHPIRANYGFEHMELPLDYFREQERLGAPRSKMSGVGENEMEPVVADLPEEQTLTHWTVRRSIDFLETRDDTRPFFLWTSFTKPHPPFDPPRAYWDLYRDRELPPPVFGDWSRTVAGMPQGLLGTTYMLNNAHRMDEAAILRSKRAYYACITQIDYNLGMLFARLSEMDLLDKTWIIFTSDHGEMMGDHHLGAKSVFLEGASHIPLLVRPPQQAWDLHPLGGVHCEKLCTLADILPTVLGLAGVTPPAQCPGLNVLDLCADDAVDRVFYGNCSDTYWSVMDGSWKYMWCAHGGEEQLFNLAEDPYEQHELAAGGAHDARLSDLRQRLVAKMAQLGHAQLVDGVLTPSRPAPRDHRAVFRWPGLHTSKDKSCDVLH